MGLSRSFQNWYKMCGDFISIKNDRNTRYMTLDLTAEQMQSLVDFLRSQTIHFLLLISDRPIPLQTVECLLLHSSLIHQYVFMSATTFLRVQIICRIRVAVSRFRYTSTIVRRPPLPPPSSSHSLSHLYSFSLHRYRIRNFQNLL